MNEFCFGWKPENPETTDRVDIRGDYTQRVHTDGFLNDPTSCTTFTTTLYPTTLDLPVDEF